MHSARRVSNSICDIELPDKSDDSLVLPNIFLNPDETALSKLSAEAVLSAVSCDNRSRALIRIESLAVLT